jgi:hypothetical protein
VVGSYGYLTTRQRLFGFILNMSRATSSPPLTLYILRGINLSRSKKVLCHWTQTVGAKPAFTVRAIPGSLTLKHAGASTFKVKLLFERYSVQLQIRDNGKGFNPALQYDGSGLIGMRERARRTGGELAIESSPGGGTEIRVVLRLGQAEALEA